MKTATRLFGVHGGLLSLIFSLFAGTLAQAQVGPFALSFYSPTNDQAFAAGANISFYLRVTDSNVVRTVQYLENGTLLRTVTNSSSVLLTNNSPTSVLSMVWSNVPAGIYQLTAVGTDAAGLTATSPAVNITVTNVTAPNVPYLVTFWYPTNGQHFVAPATVGLHAMVTDSNVVRTMQYFSGGTSVGIVTNTGNVPFTNSAQGNPFFLAWSNVPAGSYVLTAVATDVAGLNATSPAVNVTVTNPVPLCYIFSPTNNSVIVGPTNVNIYARAVETGGTIASVQFFANSLYLGSVPLSQSGVLTDVSTEPLFPLTWSNAPVGNFALKVVATDTLGASTTSSVVNISIVTNLPPVRPFVAIYSPANGAKFTVPTNINIYARAYEGSTGTVTSVQFFANSIYLGTVSNGSQMVVSNISSVPVFPLTWSNPPAGNYYLEAIATDAAGMTATSSLVSISVVTNPPPPPPVPFLVYLTNPTNGQTFAAPANVLLRALVTDSNLITTVQFFAGGTSLGIVTNASSTPPTNATAGTPFYLTWSNAPTGNYAVSALATDSAGNTATSSVVNIVVSNFPPAHPSVAIYSPANGAKFTVPTNINIYARAVEDSTGTVASVQFFANSIYLGTVSNGSQMVVSNISSVPVFPLTWSNPPAGNYYLQAIATDATGLTATSSLVSISVVTNPPPPPIPFVVNITYPTNGQTYAAPANVIMRALVTDSNRIATVQFFADGDSLGIVTNTSTAQPTSAGAPYYLTWSNVPVGNYALMALATDSAGNTASSSPVNIYVLSNLPPVVNIYAPDPVAIEGTNYVNWFQPAGSVTNYISGTNTATFLVRRDSGTNVDLTVDYAIGGTAYNGDDYEELPGFVTIPAGQRYALITIVPLDDTDSSYRYYDTVVLTLVPPTNAPPTYKVGAPNSAGAVILEENFLPITSPLIHSMADASMHISLPATNGMNYCLQISSDLMNWQTLCTNTVLKGSAQFLDPSALVNPNLFYRIIPVDTGASY